MKQCNLSSYTDDLQIFYAHSECTEVERAINSDLALVEKRYDLNGLKKNNSKHQAIVRGKIKNKPNFRCENTIIPITSQLEMLGVNINNQLKFGNHVSEVSRKVSHR